MAEELVVAAAFDDESSILDVDSAASKVERPAGATRRKGGDSGSAQHEEDLSTNQWHTTSTYPHHRRLFTRGGGCGQ